MTIYVPFTRLLAATFVAVSGFGAVFMPLTDEGAYSRYFMARWADGVRFINVEHDVAPTESILRSLWDCDAPWCSIHYGLPTDDPRGYMGCMKFGHEFIAAHPGLWHERPWTELDCVLPFNAKLPLHVHAVDATIHHRYA